jgi:hypothetical protein
MHYRTYGSAGEQQTTGSFGYLHANSVFLRRLIRFRRNKKGAGSAFRIVARSGQMDGRIERHVKPNRLLGHFDEGCS